MQGILNAGVVFGIGRANEVSFQSKLRSTQVPLPDFGSGTRMARDVIGCADCNDLMSCVCCAAGWQVGSALSSITIGFLTSDLLALPLFRALKDS